MGKHEAKEAGEDMIEPSTHPMLAIHRLGLGGDPYLAISSHQRSTGVEFTKPGCQYSIGRIVIQEWQNAHRQILLVSFGDDADRTVVTSRLYYPHAAPTAVRVAHHDSVPARPHWLPHEVDLLDCDYRVSDDSLRDYHQERLNATELGQYIEPTRDRLAAFYNWLIDAATTNH